MRLPKTLENQARNHFQYIGKLVQTECCICLKCLEGKQGKLCNLTQKEVLPSIRETWKQLSQRLPWDLRSTKLLLWQMFTLNNDYLFDGVCVCVFVGGCTHMHVTSAGDWLVKWLLFRALYQKHCWYLWDKVSHIIIHYNHDCWFLSWSLKESESLAQSHS